MTLREGLAEYYRMNPNITPPDEASEIGELFFGSHDVTHVVFGTTTQNLDEGINDMWSMWGLDISAREYLSRGLEVPEVKALFTWANMREFARDFLALPRYVPELWRRTRSMHKRWPWKDFEPYLDVSLAEIRREFGIEVI